MANPANRGLAAGAYRLATAALVEGIEDTEDTRNQVHAAAVVLGLTEDDLSVPKWDDTRR